MLVTPNKAVTDLLERLGLADANVISLILTIAADEVVTLTVKKCVTEREFEIITENLQVIRGEASS